MDKNNLSETQKLVYQMYKDQKGQPILLSPGQDYIYKSIAQKLVPRNHIMCHTRFGKSMTVALAVLTRAVTFPEKWAIIAGEEKKAMIIMDYIISHIFDNEFTTNRFMPDKNEKIEDIRRYKNKKHLTFVINPGAERKDQLLSEIYIGSAREALGYGAENVVEDEAALIDDNDHSFVMRMLGDDPRANFLAKIGNPFRRNHFRKSFHDPAYRKIVIDCYQSLREGRITQEIIDENRDYAFFKVLYECEFPRENEIDEQGYQPLFVHSDISISENRKIEPAGRGRLGLDVAKGGRNFNCWVFRQDNYARVLRKDSEENSVKIAEQTQKFMRELGVVPQEVFIDDTGVGHGVVSIMKNRNLKVNAVNFGEKASDNKKYLNIRAEVYAGDNGVQPWVKQGAKLEAHEGWQELTKIRYRKQSGGKTQIEPKEDMRKRGVESPDVADALALTFAKNKIITYTGINPGIVLGAGQSQFGGVPRYI